MIEIRTIEGRGHRAICKKVAQIHAKNLTVGLLPVLGQPFLEGLYRSAARDRSSVLIVAVEEGRVIGFAMGSIYPPSFYLGSMLVSFPRILGAIAKRPRVLGRILSVLRYAARSNSNPAAELLSIAVCRKCRGTGVSVALLREFKLKMMVNDVHSFRVTAADTQMAALKFYRKNGGIAVSDCDLGGLRSITFIIETDPSLNHRQGQTSRCL
jgi:ribosomal protein S18 acetylase RimI-like enzyme